MDYFFTGFNYGVYSSNCRHIFKLYEQFILRWKERSWNQLVYDNSTWCWFSSSAYIASRCCLKCNTVVMLCAWQEKNNSLQKCYVVSLIKHGLGLARPRFSTAFWGRSPKVWTSCVRRLFCSRLWNLLQSKRVSAYVIVYTVKMKGEGRGRSKEGFKLNVTASC